MKHIQLQYRDKLLVTRKPDRFGALKAFGLSCLAVDSLNKMAATVTGTMVLEIGRKPFEGARKMVFRRSKIYPEDFEAEHDSDLLLCANSFFHVLGLPKNTRKVTLYVKVF